jgi:hypothetical protein
MDEVKLVDNCPRSAQPALGVDEKEKNELNSHPHSPLPRINQRVNARARASENGDWVG